MLTKMEIDPYLEDEYFLPLVREALWSFIPAVQKQALAIAEKDSGVFDFIKDWLESSIIQYELSEVLAGDKKAGVKGLVRLLNLYCRFPVHAPKLEEGLKLYKNQVNSVRISHLVDILLEKISRDAE